MGLWPHTREIKEYWPMTPLFIRSAFLAAVFCLAAATGTAAPVLQYSFDTPGKGIVKESVSGGGDMIEGSYRHTDGVSGRAIKPDGYTTRIVRKSADAPKLSGGFTVEAWVAQAAYPWNWAPVLSRRDGEKKGFYFAVGPRGDMALELAVGGKWRRCVSDPMLVPLRQWTHISATYDPAGGATLYVNGKESGKLKLTGDVDWAADADMVSMMNSKKLKPSHIHRKFGTLPGWFSIDGLVDEIKLYNKVLSPEQIVAAAEPPKGLAGPALPIRKMPIGPKGPGRFGAYYTKLKYYPEWDDLWSVDKHTDIVVRFDRSPVRMVFWRGTRYSPAWVSENGLWMADQSVEAWNDKEGCYEHMQDRRCRYSRIRIIESNDARVVVHWRYAPVSAHDKLWREDEKTTRACWVDEYYYIYPDQFCVRKPTWRTGALGRPRQFQESLPLTNPGQMIGDIINADFACVANLKGQRHKISFVDKPRKRKKPEDLVIQQYNFRSKNKPSIIFEPGNRMEYVEDRKTPSRGLMKTPGACNHWPVGQGACDGRTVQATDRPTCFLGFPISNPPIHKKDGRSWWNGLYGMSELDMGELVVVARSWSRPSELRVTTGGFVSQGYDRSARAYRLTKNKSGRDSKLELILAATEASPVFNPVFVIKGWSPDALTAVLNGKKIEKGSDFRIGRRHTLEGRDIIIWLKAKSTKPVSIILAPK
jgi:hypothetical protein